jgi:hypothetical protein
MKRACPFLWNPQGSKMNAVNNFPKPVIIGVVVVLMLIAGFVIFRTASNVSSNYGYGSREDIARLQQQGGAGQDGGRSAPTNTQSAPQGSGRGGYPTGSSGYGRGPGR